MQKATVVILFLISSLYSYSQNYDITRKIDDPEVINQLLIVGEKVRYFYDQDNLELMPALPFKDIILQKIEQIDFNLGVEILFLFDLPQEIINLDHQELLIYNTLRKISTMKGVEYYSTSRKKMWQLFEQSYVNGRKSYNSCQKDFPGVLPISVKKQGNPTF